MALFGRPTERDEQKAKAYAQWMQERNPFAIAAMVLGVFSLVEFGVLIVGLFFTQGISYFDVNEALNLLDGQVHDTASGGSIQKSADRVLGDPGDMLIDREAADP